MKIPRSDFSKYMAWIAGFKKWFKCVNCGEPLHNEPIEDAWRNDKEFAWLYIQCPRCGYQNALWKILQRIPRIIENECGCNK